jgi:hypothetical protein
MTPTLSSGAFRASRAPHPPPRPAPRRAGHRRGRERVWLGGLSGRGRGRWGQLLYRARHDVAGAVRVLRRVAALDPAAPSCNYTVEHPKVARAAHSVHAAARGGA